MKITRMIKVVMLTICLLPSLVFAGGPPPGGYPSVPEPSTVLAGAACLIPLALGIVNAMRKPRK